MGAESKKKGFPACRRKKNTHPHMLRPPHIPREALPFTAAFLGNLSEAISHLGRSAAQSRVWKTGFEY